MGWQVTCITKHNRFDPNSKIQSLGGIDGAGTYWRLTEQEVISRIQMGWEFFTYVGGRKAILQIAGSAFFGLYLKTDADGFEPNNLLSLPECL